VLVLNCSRTPSESASEDKWMVCGEEGSDSRRVLAELWQPQIRRCAKWNETLPAPWWKEIWTGRQSRCKGSFAFVWLKWLCFYYYQIDISARKLEDCNSANTPPGSPPLLPLSYINDDCYIVEDGQQVDVNPDPSEEGINADPSEDGDDEGPLDLSTRHWRS